MPWGRWVALAGLGALCLGGCSPEVQAKPAPPVDRGATEVGPARTAARLRSVATAVRPPTSTTLLALSGPAPYGKRPGGPTAGTEPGRIFGARETLPIIATSGSRVEVLLPGPPNGATGWMSSSAGTEETDSWAVVVSIDARSISVYRSGALVGTSPVAVGAPATPTPVPPGGETFIDGDVAAAGTMEAPTLRPIALHVQGREAEVDDASIGADQVAIHGWADERSDPSVFGRAVSHACVRVPATFASAYIAQLPNGTPVFI